MKWENLNNPPVAVALFQMKYNAKGRKLDDFLKFDVLLKHHLPHRQNNVNVEVNVENTSIPLGTSKITGTTDAKVDSYTYFSNDQKSRLEISVDTISYIDERKYSGWEHFKNETGKYLSIIYEVLSGCEIVRTSIRFINRFTFDTFDNPQDYFRTLISSVENNQLPFPLRQYGFRLFMDVPNTDVYSIVNQNIENVTNKYIYTFDIDVLDKQRLIFNVNTIIDNMDILRDVKNQIFFNNLTQKTLDLCS